MKAEPGHIYADVRMGAVALLFTDKDLPEWADENDDPPHEHGCTMLAIDVTGNVPAVGDLYDATSGKFSPAPPPAAVVPSDEEIARKALLEQLDVVSSDPAAPASVKALAPLLKKVL